MAISWEHDLRSAITEAKDENGQTQFVFNPQILEYYLQTIASLSRDKGRYIETDEDRLEIEKKLKQLIGVMEIVRETHTEDQDILIRTAYAYAMGASLSMENMEENAYKLYKTAHTHNPGEPMLNYLFGMFMFGTKKYHDECKPYLETALDHGVEAGRFTLGLLYIHEGNTEKGREHIKQYAEDNPDNKHAQLVWNAVERGELNFQA